MSKMLIVLKAFLFLCTFNCQAIKPAGKPKPNPSIKKFVLITTLYNETNPKRIQEYLTCLTKNNLHPSISTIHVLYDTLKDMPNQESSILYELKKKNVIISYIEGRPSFGQIFNLANTKYAGRNIIISNADIYFNKTLSLLNSYALDKKFLALTRWDVQQNGSLKQFKTELAYYSGFSQDTWIFKSPIKPFEYMDIKLGTLGCDSNISYQAYKAGLKVINPSNDIQCCHVHTSNIRNYEEKYNPLCLFLLNVPVTALKAQGEYFLAELHPDGSHFLYYKKVPPYYAPTY